MTFISFAAFAIGVAARQRQQDVRRLDDGDNRRAFFQFERLRGGFGDDRDDFAAAGQAITTSALTTPLVILLILPKSLLRVLIFMTFFF
jgi:hypothetical protein